MYVPGCEVGLGCWPTNTNNKYYNNEYNLQTKEENLQHYIPGYGVRLGFGATNSNYKYNSEQ